MAKVNSTNAWSAAIKAAQAAAKNKNTVANAYYDAIVSGKTKPQGYENVKADPGIQQQRDTALSGLQDVYNTNSGQLGNAYNQGVSEANLNADNAARQQYILYRQNKNKLAEQLSAGGITGGASETALNNIMNAYSTNLASNEAARQSALSDLGNEYQNNLSSLMAQLQQNQADINNQYAQLEAEDLAQRRNNYVSNATSALEAYLNSQKQNKVDKWNSNIQSQIQKKNPNYVWMDSDGRLHYNNSSAAASQAKAQGYKVVENKTKNSTTKKSTKKNSKSQSKDGSDYSSVWGNSGSSGSKKNIEQAITNSLANGTLSYALGSKTQSPLNATSANAAINYLESLVNKGQITTSKAKKYAKNAGLKV